MRLQTADPGHPFSMLRKSLYTEPDVPGTAGLYSVPWSPGFGRGDHEVTCRLVQFRRSRLEYTGAGRYWEHGCLCCVSACGGRLSAEVQQTPQLSGPKEPCAMARPVPLLLVLLLYLIPLHLQVQLGPSRCVKGLPPVLHSCVGTPSPTGTQ